MLKHGIKNKNYIILRLTLGILNNYSKERL